MSVPPPPAPSPPLSSATPGVSEEMAANDAAAVVSAAREARRSPSIDLLFRPLPKGLEKIHGVPVLYPNHYAWYVLVSFLDVMLTVKLLLHLGAREVNTIAQVSIELFGTWGLIGLKTLSMVVVVMICEYIGRRRLELGKRVAVMAIAVSLFPVSAALIQVMVYTAKGDVDWIERPIDEDTGYPIEP